MFDILMILHKILSESATVHIYSYPPFALETFLAVLICIIYGYLHAEITNMGKVMQQLRCDTFQFEKPLRESFSNVSICTSIIQRHQYMLNVDRSPSLDMTYKGLCKNCNASTQLEWIMSRPMTEWSSTAYKSKIYKQDKCFAETLASLSPSEYVKRDREHRLQKRCLHSLTSLYDNVVQKKFSESTLTTHLEMAKEEAQCTKMAVPPTILSVPADAMTQSLFELLEKIVSTSVSNPSPYTGNVTSIALDVTHVISKQSNLFDHTCDLPAENSANERC